MHLLTDLCRSGQVYLLDRDELAYPDNSTGPGLPETLAQVGNRDVLLSDGTRFVRADRSTGAAVDNLTNFMERVLK